MSDKYNNNYYYQCFEIKRNPFFTYFIGKSILCKRSITGDKALESLEENRNNFGSNYKEFPLIKLDKQYFTSTYGEEFRITQKLNLPLDTEIYIS